MMKEYIVPEIKITKKITSGIAICADTSWGENWVDDPTLKEDS